MRDRLRSTRHTYRAARARLGRLARRPTAHQPTASEGIARALAELEGFAVDANEVVVTETDVGRLLLHADDQVMTPLIQRDHLWEAPEGRFLRGAIRPGATVVDVGANVGYMTLLSARAAGRRGQVLAVEPEQANLALLRANVWLNGTWNVKVLPVAAWSRRELLPLRFNADNRGDHQVGVAGGGGSARLVPAVPLDELLGEMVVDVVKIDTQGSDHEALAGLSATLARSPAAAVLIEFWLGGFDERGISPRAVLGGYRNAGFSVALLQDSGHERPASDDEVMAACEGWQGRFVNLVLRRAER